MNIFAQGLKLLLLSGEEEMETNQQTQTHGDVSTWILNKLPSIPHFVTARPQVIRRKKRTSPRSVFSA